MQFLVFDKSIAGSDEDDCRVAGNIEAIFEASYEPVTDGKTIVALRVDIDGAHIITDEVIEAVAARYLRTFEQDARVPAWLEATDAYDEWAEDQPQTWDDIASCRADKWRDERLAGI